MRSLIVLLLFMTCCSCAVKPTNYYITGTNIPKYESHDAVLAGSTTDVDEYSNKVVIQSPFIQQEIVLSHALLRTIKTDRQDQAIDQIYVRVANSEWGQDKTAMDKSQCRFDVRNISVDFSPKYVPTEDFTIDVDPIYLKQLSIGLDLQVYGRGGRRIINVQLPLYYIEAFLLYRDKMLSQHQ